MGRGTHHFLRALVSQPAPFHTWFRPVWNRPCSHCRRPTAPPQRAQGTHSCSDSHEDSAPHTYHSQRSFCFSQWNQPNIKALPTLYTADSIYKSSESSFGCRTWEKCVSFRKRAVSLRFWQRWPQNCVILGSLDYSACLSIRDTTKPEHDLRDFLNPWFKVLHICVWMHVE